MSFEENDLEIVYELRWKNEPRNKGDDDRANIMGILDSPDTCADWTTFKSYLTQNSGTSEDISVAYIDSDGGEILITEDNYKSALEYSREKARKKQKIVLALEKRKDTSRMSVDQRAKAIYMKNSHLHKAPVTIKDACCGHDLSDSEDDYERPPAWFLKYMKKFKQELGDMMVETLYLMMTNDDLVEDQPVVPVEKQKTKKQKVDEDSSDSLEGMKLKDKIMRKAENHQLREKRRYESKLMKLENKAKRIIERKYSIVSAGTQANVLYPILTKKLVDVMAKPNKKHSYAQTPTAPPMDATAKKSTIKNEKDVGCRHSRSSSKSSTKLVTPKQDRLKRKDVLDAFVGVPMGACMDAMPLNRQMVTEFAARGAIVTKRWEVVNNGLYPWTDETELRFTWGSSTLVPLKKVVKVPKLVPGETGCVEVVMQVPDALGRFESYWHFFHNETRFGHWLGCVFVIGLQNKYSTGKTPYTVCCPSINTDHAVDLTTKCHRYGFLPKTSVNATTDDMKMSETKPAGHHSEIRKISVRPVCKTTSATNMLITKPEKYEHIYEGRESHSKTVVEIVKPQHPKKECTLEVLSKSDPIVKPDRYEKVDIVCEDNGSLKAPDVTVELIDCRGHTEPLVKQEPEKLNLHQSLREEIVRKYVDKLPSSVCNQLIDLSNYVMKPDFSVKASFFDNEEDELEAGASVSTECHPDNDETENLEVDSGLANSKTNSDDLNISSDVKINNKIMTELLDNSFCDTTCDPEYNSDSDSDNISVISGSVVSVGSSDLGEEFVIIPSEGSSTPVALDQVQSVPITEPITVEIPSPNSQSEISAAKASDNNNNTETLRPVNPEPPIVEVAHIQRTPNIVESQVDDVPKQVKEEKACLEPPALTVIAEAASGISKPEGHSTTEKNVVELQQNDNPARPECYAPEAINHRQYKDRLHYYMSLANADEVFKYYEAGQPPFCYPGYNEICSEQQPKDTPQKPEQYQATEKPEAVKYSHHYDVLPPFMTPGFAHSTFGDPAFGNGPNGPRFPPSWYPPSSPQSHPTWRNGSSAFGNDFATHEQHVPADAPRVPLYYGNDYFYPYAPYYPNMPGAPDCIYPNVAPYPDPNARSVNNGRRFVFTTSGTGFETNRDFPEKPASSSAVSTANASTGTNSANASVTTSSSTISESNQGPTIGENNGYPRSTRYSYVFDNPYKTPVPTKSEASVQENATTNPKNAGPPHAVITSPNRAGVHILPETLVNGAVNVASNAFNTACTVFDIFRGNNEEMGSSANRSKQPSTPSRRGSAPTSAANTDTNTTAETNIPYARRSLQNCLHILYEMGFYDRGLNIKLLKRYDNDLPIVISKLI